jgi:hypothetical protein
MANDLLLEISKCEEIEQSWNNNEHPCSKITLTQDSGYLSDFQVPEPWTGQIETATILFISSNPSISEEEIFPTMTWEDEDIVDYFQNRFGGGQQTWIVDGTKSLRKDGSYGQWTRFWAGVKGRAAELLERDPLPGIDYTLTELVHCKSRQEEGVIEALDHCVSLYLDRVLEISGARILVGLGALAREVLARKYKFPSCKMVFGPLEVAGRKRLITFLTHPNAWKDKTFRKVHSAPELVQLKDFLRSTGE